MSWNVGRDVNSRGGGSSNVVGIICPPLIFIGVNGPPNFGGTHVSLSVILTIVV